MANISSDVEHLRQQYNAGKGQHDRLTIHYNDKPFRDGDELKKSDTQTEPKVQISLEGDMKSSHYTLVNSPIRAFEMYFFLLFHRSWLIQMLLNEETNALALGYTGFKLASRERTSTVAKHSVGHLCTRKEYRLN